MDCEAFLPRSFLWAFIREALGCIADLLADNLTFSIVLNETWS